MSLQLKIDFRNCRRVSCQPTSISQQLHCGDDSTATAATPTSNGCSGQWWQQTIDCRDRQTALIGRTFGRQQRSRSMVLDCRFTHKSSLLSILIDVVSISGLVWLILTSCSFQSLHSLTQSNSSHSTTHTASLRYPANYARELRNAASTFNHASLSFHS